MTEKDWKIFKKIKEQAIELFCRNSLNEFREAMEDESQSAHNRYLYNYKLVENRDKQMSVLFDGHSRSRAPIQLIAIRGEGLANETLVAKLSDELRKQTDPANHNW